MLAAIPFVRLRPLLPPDALAGNLSFSAVVAATQSHLEPPQLAIHLSKRRLRCGSHEIRLPPQLFTFYAWLAQRQLAGLPPVRHTDATPTEFLAIYAATVGIDAVDYEKTAKMLTTDGFSKEFFEQKCAKVNRQLKSTLGFSAAPYLITPQGQRPLTRYGLTLPPGQISFDAPAKLAKP